MLDAYLVLLDLAYYEVTFAFEGLVDDHVWKRPSETLLSVGELAGHIAYWQANKLAGEGEDLAKCRVRSPLIDRQFRYYDTTLATTPSDEHLAMTAEQVCRELVRVHEESVSHFRALNPDLGSHPPGSPPHYTYHQFLKYASFHCAYHTGQMYTVRHLLGETTPDN
ncbi:MAG: DinB family protein [Chloroflexi bacterium]|nr:DinB family protein [Chloroflexota bacterium]